MNIKKSLLPSLISAAILPTAALAEQPSYSYVESGYIRANFDNIDLDPEGFYLEGSVELNEDFFLRGAYSDTEDDILGIDFDIQDYQLGIGYKKAISPDASWYLAVDYLEGEVDVQGLGDADANGYQLATGIRGFVAEKLELQGELGYVDVEDEDGFVGSVGAVFHLTTQFGLTLEAGIDEDDNSVTTLGFRATF